jgi:hypothetical protein
VLRRGAWSRRAIPDVRRQSFFLPLYLQRFRHCVWKITNKANNAAIYITAIDASGGVNVAEAAFRKLNDGQLLRNDLTVL